MLRLRFLRVLLPVLLAFLGLLLWKSWEPRSAVHRLPDAGGQGEAPVVEELAVKEFGPGSDSSFAGHAAVFEPHDDGSLHLEGIRDLEIQREERGPLLVSAERGNRTGEKGRHRWNFTGQVVFREPEEGLRLALRSLEIDDAAGVARSSGEIRFEASRLSGRAASMVYGLRGQPGTLERPEIEDRHGGHLTARRARLLDGIRDIELEGEVRAVHPDKRLRADRLRLIRGPEERLRQAVATGNVAADRVGGPPATVRGQRLEMRWDGAGEVEFVALEGNALLTRVEETLSASSIEAVRDGEDGGDWKLDARGGVYVRGSFGGAPGLLRAERVQAALDEALVPRRADASGRVSFDGRDIRAEAERGSWSATATGEGRVELLGDDVRKARLAQGRTRIAARTIRTDLRGTELEAEGRVEATLLPQPSDGSAPARTRLFLTEQAIHFVSDRLRSEDGGRRLRFEGAVRGWQGERNLAAGRVVVDEGGRTLRAKADVATRFPREPGQSALTEADYIQIGADTLDYDDQRGLAIYAGNVRVRLVEGWLEAERVEAELSLDSRRIREIRASTDVRVEFERTAEGEMARPVTGTADRLVYKPGTATVRLFGDQAPAAVRRIGQGGGTTTGRVLRYRVDSGTLDVDSGEQGPGRIRS